MSTTFDDVAKQFLDDIPVAKTQAAYRTGLNTFADFLGSVPIQSVREPTLTEFWRWLRRRKPAGQWHMDVRKLSDQTIRSYLDAVVAFLAYLSDESVLPDSFSLDKAKRQLRRARRESKTPYPTRNPDQALPLIILHYDNQPLPAADNNQNRRRRLILLRNRAIVHVLYSTAGRITEVAHLSRRDVGDGKSDVALVVGKGSKVRTLFFTPEARKAIQNYLAEREDTDAALFVGHRRKGRVGTRVLWQVVKDAARAEGLADVHPHDFRHLRASQMLSEGAPLEVVQEILGHADIGTTRRIYAAYSRAAVKVAFDAYRLSPREALAKAQAEGKALSR